MRKDCIDRRRPHFVGTVQLIYSTSKSRTGERSPYPDFDIQFQECNGRHSMIKRREKALWIIFMFYTPSSLYSSSFTLRTPSSLHDFSYGANVRIAYIKCNQVAPGWRAVYAFVGISLEYVIYMLLELSASYDTLLAMPLKTCLHFNTA